MSAQSKTTSVGATTSVCSLSDQVKKYKPKHFSTNVESKDCAKESGPSSLFKCVNGWKVEPLTVMCLKLITHRFCQEPSLGGIPRRFLPDITMRLPIDLDIKVSAPYIMDENYWKRCCLNKPEWSNIQIIDHGLTWKQLFLEQNLQEVLESFEISESAVNTLLGLVKASQDYIFSLVIHQLLSHVELDQIIALLPNLTRLSLTYGVKKVGMKYERMLFGMKISDATSLAKGLQNTMTLTTLLLPSNLLDDDLLRMLMVGLTKNSTITHLDLSHNKLTNHGARLLSKLLGPNSVITSLNLCDNQIHAEGGRYLSRGLRHNSSLIDFNLRLNRLTDEGGRMLIEGIVDHQSLSSLHLSSNSLGSETSKAISRVLQDPKCCLTKLDLTGNDITEEDAICILEGLEENIRLIGMDLRQNQIPQSAQCLQDILSIVRRNEVDSRRQ